MKIVIPGGSGQVGTLLARAFHARGDEVVVLSRAPVSTPWRVVAWDARTHGAWAQEFEGADVVVNLAGRSVNCRYTPSNRDLIMRSRVDSTVVVGEAIAAAAKPPRIWLQASTATIYSHRYDAPNDEATGLIGGDEPGAPNTWRFSIDVARAWEDAVDRFALPATRVVKLRSAMVMSPDAGGIFATSTSVGPSTSPPRIRCPTPSSCAYFDEPGEHPLVYPRPGGCLSSAPWFSKLRQSSSSRAAESCRERCFTAASRLRFRIGSRPRTNCVGDGVRKFFLEQRRMKKLLVIVALVAATPVEIAAQSNQAEQEVRTFLAAYDKAVASRDIAFLERVLPDDYVLSGERGRTANRAEMLKFYTQERDNPSYRRISLTHDNVMIRVVGNMAVVTNDYTSQVAPIETPDAEPDLFKGRHTGVFEKREGRWMVIVEQDTEQIHDDKLMERQVASAGRDYHELIKRLRSGRSYAELEESGEITKLTRVLADEFTGTSGDGAVTRKAEALQAQKSNQIVLESAELLEQSVLAIDNSAAIETGKVRYVGTDAGKRVDITQRYTATWVSWGRGWQIIAYHSSVLKGTP